jgi:hypothetical protein
MSTTLHKRILSADYGDQERTDLMVKVWAGTPFVVNVRTGSINSEAEREIAEWCRESFGPDAWPIHGKPGKWQRGSATVHGETFMGFDTAETLAIFMGRFGHLVIEDEAPSPQPKMEPVEIPGELEMFEGKLTKVVDASRTGWWRFHAHRDRDGYCDNPARGY